jgi:hypothetical protein
MQLTTNPTSPISPISNAFEARKKHAEANKELLSGSENSILGDHISLTNLDDFMETFKQPRKASHNGLNAYAATIAGTNQYQNPMEPQELNKHI